MSRIAAMNTLQACLADPEVMATAVKYFLVKYPGQAVACIAGETYGTLTVNVPYSSGFGVGAFPNCNWNSATHQIKAKDIKEFVRLYKDGQKVASIKEARARLNLGLKEAKDLCEYLGESGKF